MSRRFALTRPSACADAALAEQRRRLMSLSPRDRVLAALRAGALGNVLQRAKKVEKVEMSENKVSVCFCELGTHALYKDCAKYLAEARAGERELAEQMRRVAEGGEEIQRRKAETLEAALHSTRARLMAVEKALLKEQGRSVGDAAHFEGVVEAAHGKVERLKVEHDAAAERQRRLEAENAALRKERMTVFVMLQSAVVQNSKPEHAERAMSYPEPWLIGRLQGLIWEARTEALEAAAERCERVRARWHGVEGAVAETRAETARELRDTILNIKMGQHSQEER